jgi:hypothetical protein
MKSARFISRSTQGGATQTVYAVTPPICDSDHVLVSTIQGETALFRCDREGKFQIGDCLGNIAPRHDRGVFEQLGYIIL